MNTDTLASLLDPLAEDLFFKRAIAVRKRESAAKAIAARQGLQGSYFGLFAPTRADFSGIRLFTGESVRSRAGISHMLGEECCRLLVMLHPKSSEARAALERATRNMSVRLDEAEHDGTPAGTYCCGTCSTAYWRNLALGVFPNSEERLEKGLAHLAKHRTENGEWARFPFYFTSLVLTEIGASHAKKEFQHAAVRWEKILPRLSASQELYANRRAAVGHRILSQA